MVHGCGGDIECQLIIYDSRIGNIFGLLTFFIKIS